MYRLSDRVSVELKQSVCSVSEQHIKLVKSSENTRWMNFSMPVWQILVDSYTTVSMDAASAPEGDYEKTYRISSDTTLKLSRFKGALYVGFGQRKGRYFNIINLNLLEWNSLKSAIDVLNIQPKKEPVLLQYQWCLVRGDGIVIRSSDWTFLRDQCNNEGETYEALHSLQGLDAKLIINEREHILPPPMELLKMTYTYLVQKEVHCIVKERCYGCLGNRDSQNDHLTGCLDLESDHFDLHVTEASTRVPIEKAIDLIGLLFKEFNLPQSPIFQEPLTLPTVTEGDMYGYHKTNYLVYQDLFDFLNN